MNFKVLEEERRERPAINVHYYKYVVEITSFPYVGRTRVFGRPEGQLLVVGATYAGKIYHRKVPVDHYSSFSGKTYAELDIRRDI